MKRILLSLTLLATLGTVWAGNYNYLTLATGATAQSVVLRSVKRLSFEGTNLIVTMADGSTTATPLTSLTAISFTEEASESGVRSLAAQSGTLRLDDGRIVVEGNGILTLYGAGGQIVRQMAVRSGHGEMNLTSLARGIYLARFGNTTLKLAH